MIRLALDATESKIVERLPGLATKPLQFGAAGAARYLHPQVASV
jgi:hypothetical protein